MTRSRANIQAAVEMEASLELIRVRLMAILRLPMTNEYTVAEENPMTESVVRVTVSHGADRNLARHKTMGRTITT